MWQRLWYNIKFPVYLQRSSSDCGIECLRMMLAFYKLPHSHSLVAKYLSYDIYGTNFKSIQEAALSLGLDCLAVKLSLNELTQTAPLPCILHWQNDHFVVLYKLNNQNAWIVDPAKGIRKLSIHELVSNCLSNNSIQEPKGMVLLFEKQENFKQESEQVTKPKLLFHIMNNIKTITVSIIIGICLAFILAQFQLIISLKRHAIDHFKTEFLFSTLWLIFLAYYVLKQLRKVKDVEADMEDCFSTNLLELDKERRQDHIFESINCFYRIKYHNLHWIHFWLGVSTVIGVSVFTLHSSIFVFTLWSSIICLYTMVKLLSLNNYDKVNTSCVNEATLLQSDITRFFEEAIEIEHSGKHLNNKSEISSILKNADLNVTDKPQYYLLNSILILGFLIILFFINEKWINTAQAIIASISVFAGCISLDMIIRYCWNYTKIRKPKKLEQLKPVKDSNLTLNNADDPSFHISLDHVHFAYPSENWSSSLKDINLEIPEGSKVLVMGRAGSGKSSLLKLLTKEITDYSGRIMIGDNDFSLLSRNQLTQYLGVINDESKLLSGSLAWNISLEKDYDKKKMDYVIKSLFIDSYINNLPEGLDTNMMAPDIYMPPGVVKKILLARLLYLNKAINLIDLEDFNANNVQNLIMFESLFTAAKDSTILMVSSDVELAQSADKIIVMEDGEIVEYGNYNDLVEKAAVFSSFVKQQKLMDL